MHCAPGIKQGLHGCFDQSALIRIAKAYNVRYPKTPIQISDTQLWDRIRQGLASLCGENEWCWLDQPFLKGDSVLQEYYKPPKPITQTKWLGTTDINRVLKQFEHIYPDFAFMGTVPIDFDQIIEEYAKIDLCRLSGGQGLQLSGPTQSTPLYQGRKVRRFGFVFNLDPHDQGGSHWVCMFLDLTVDQPWVGYFDSYGHCPPPKQMMVLMDRLKQQAKRCLKIDLVKRCNPIRHQHKHTECGTYCLYFIYQCLKGRSFDSITESIILDDDVNQYRDFFFRPTMDFIHE